MSVAPTLGSTVDDANETTAFRRGISHRTSVALDLLRGSAAIAVFLHHCNWEGMDAGYLSCFRRDVGHSAVVVFFILSGYLIASTVDSTKTIYNYAVNRGARIYSVAIPAVLLSLAVSAGLSWSGQTLAAPYELLKPWTYVVVALSFTGDVWTITAPAFENVPYWSLGYEVWYYALFGFAVFLKRPWSWIFAFVAFAAMGPRLWLLLPVWLAGVLVFRMQAKFKLRRSAARLCLVASMLALIFLKVFQLDSALAVTPIVFGYSLRFSQWFLGDYLVGLITASMIFAISFAEVPTPKSVAVFAGWIAGASFGLYISHYPLLLVAKAMLPNALPLGAALAGLAALAFARMFEPLGRPLRRVLQAYVPILLSSHR